MHKSSQERLKLKEADSGTYTSFQQTEKSLGLKVW